MLGRVTPPVAANLLDLRNRQHLLEMSATCSGPLGIVTPHVDTATEAREVANRLKYPPVGHRSMGGIGPHYGLRFANSGASGSSRRAGLTGIRRLPSKRRRPLHSRLWPS